MRSLALGALGGRPAPADAGDQPAGSPIAGVAVGTAPVAEPARDAGFVQWIAVGVDERPILLSFRRRRARTGRRGRRMEGPPRLVHIRRRSARRHSFGRGRGPFTASWPPPSSPSSPASGMPRSSPRPGPYAWPSLLFFRSAPSRRVRRAAPPRRRSHRGRDRSRAGSARSPAPAAPPARGARPLALDDDRTRHAGPGRARRFRAPSRPAARRSGPRGPGHRHGAGSPRNSDDRDGPRDHLLLRSSARSSTS